MFKVLPPTSCFLLGLPYDPKRGGRVFLRGSAISQNQKKIQHRRPYYLNNQMDHKYHFIQQVQAG